LLVNAVGLVHRELQKKSLVWTLVETRICLQPGQYTPVRPIITGDGKAMLASNFRETERCWLCDGPAADWGLRLQPIATFPNHASLHWLRGA
jgi:hypothetical protein